MEHIGLCVSDRAAPFLFCVRNREIKTNLAPLAMEIVDEGDRSILLCSGSINLSRFEGAFFFPRPMRRVQLPR